ncbi:MAG: GNAT family N-acetyltransferase [Adhaeribacter sp.]
MEYQFRKAEIPEIPAIWDILQGAIRRRKEEGSRQWQDGYPNPEVIRQDIERGAGYVLTGTGAEAAGGREAGALIGYCAVLVNDEPAYAGIEGKWLTEADFVVIHRVAVAEPFLGKGMAQNILGAVETLAREKQIYSIKADTNFDNIAMMKTFEKLGYVYCGEVYFRGSARRAYEKILDKAGPSFQPGVLK